MRAYERTCLDPAAWGLFPHVGQLTFNIFWMRTDLDPAAWGFYPQVGQLTY